MTEMLLYSTFQSPPALAIMYWISTNRLVRNRQFVYLLQVTVAATEVE